MEIGLYVGVKILLSCNMSLAIGLLNLSLLFSREHEQIVDCLCTSHMYSVGFKSRNHYLFGLCALIWAMILCHGITLQ